MENKLNLRSIKRDEEPIGSDAHKTNVVNLLLLGASGCGKSSLIKSFAQRYGVVFDINSGSGLESKTKKTQIHSLIIKIKNDAYTVNFIDTMGFNDSGEDVQVVFKELERAELTQINKFIIFIDGKRFVKSQRQVFSDMILKYNVKAHKDQVMIFISQLSYCPERVVNGVVDSCLTDRNIKELMFPDFRNITDTTLVPDEDLDEATRIAWKDKRERSYAVLEKIIIDISEPIKFQNTFCNLI